MTLNKGGGSRSLMTMTDHLVTKARCKDLPHSDRGDSRCRRAVDSSSLSMLRLSLSMSVIGVPVSKRKTSRTNTLDYTNTMPKPGSVFRYLKCVCMISINLTWFLSSNCDGQIRNCIMVLVHFNSLDWRTVLAGIDSETISQFEGREKQNV